MFLKSALVKSGSSGETADAAGGGVTRRGVVIAAAGALAACSSDDALGPSALLFVSSKQMAQLARPVWAHVLKRESLSEDDAALTRAERVGSKIIRASRNEPSDWEIAVFQSDEVAAFALPNRKIGITSGLLARAESDDQFAAVLALAVAHVNYNHYGERYSRSRLADNGLTAAGIAASGRAQPQAVRGLFGVSGAAENLVSFSRDHVLSADKFALRYLQRAGYDAGAALTFWSALAASEESARAPLLLMHPVDSARLTRLKREIAYLPTTSSKAPLPAAPSENQGADTAD